MCETRAASVISVGTELTEGIIQDSHVRFISSELTSLGFRVKRGVQIPDDTDIFRAELRGAVQECCLVVITGGLGPTSDDLAREIVAECAGEPLEFHPEVWEALLARFKGRTLADSNRKQAMAPRGFSLIDNPNGTAPGFHGRVGEALVVCLPGPPGELRPMFSGSVVPLVAGLFGLSQASEILWGTAILVPESDLEQELRACRAPGVTWGTRVDEDRIVFSLRGGAVAERRAVLDQLAVRLGDMRLREGDVRPAAALSEALLARGMTLVTAESCTGGLLGKWITDLPGSSRVYWGGFITYSNEAKAGALGVEGGLLEAQGAVSREAVLAMAAGALAHSGAGIAIAVSGVAGPDGGTAEKPVGTVWIAAGQRGGASTARLLRLAGSRDAIRRRTAVASFLMAEALIRGKEFLDSLAKW